jgi:hypothetical protein
MTSIGVRIRSMCRCGEFASYISGWVSGSPNCGRQNIGWSVVPNIWSSIQSPAWLTMALKRSVWPAIQLAM